MTAPQLPGRGIFLFIGGCFGSSLVAYLILCKGQKSILKMVVLISGSVVAYFCAVMGPLALAANVFRRLIRSEQFPELPQVFEGGMIGGFILSSTVFLTFSRATSSRWTALWKIAVASLASAGVGAFAWTLAPSLGQGLWSLLPASAYPSGDPLNQDSLTHYSLFFVWQPFMAILIGLLLPAIENTSARNDAPVSWRRVLTVFAVTLVILAARITPIRLRVAQRDRAYHQIQALRPSNKDLPVLQPTPIAEALILQEIDGFRPTDPITGVEMQSNEKDAQLPGDYEFAVTYKSSREPPPPASTEWVAVTVRQYPTPQWAQYLGDYPPRVYNPFDDPKHHALITKFRNKVRTNFFERYPPGAVSLYYTWPSAKCVVTITYNLNEYDDFLRLYMEKYPSSIE